MNIKAIHRERDQLASLTSGKKSNYGQPSLGVKIHKIGFWEHIEKVQKNVKELPLTGKYIEINHRIV